jgi:DNA ligase-1
MQFPILYKYTSKGQPQQWQIFVAENSFYTEEGMVGGKLTTSLPTFCTAKNVGRANETTPQQQAISEAKAKYQKKLDTGYSESLGGSGAKFFEPMLAFEYSKYPDVLFTRRTFVQPKLDGLRCDNANGKLTSRNGKPYISCPHLEQGAVRLDGELYTHFYKDDFNKIVSLCKKQKPTKEDLQESAEKVEMWIYDFPEHIGVFSERYEALRRWHSRWHKYYHKENSKFILVPTFEVRTMDEIIAYHAQFINEGYEGTIIRIDLGPYENKRSKQLLKYKDFKDEEFEIVGYEEGEGGRAGTIGFFIMKHDKNPEQTFKSNVKGNFEYLREVWENRDSYIGKKATVKYFNRTPKTEDGGDVPRFPYIIKINREEYE